MCKRLENSCWTCRPLRRCAIRAVASIVPLEFWIPRRILVSKPSLWAALVVLLRQVTHGRKVAICETLSSVVRIDILSRNRSHVGLRD